MVKYFIFENYLTIWCIGPKIFIQNAFSTINFWSTNFWLKNFWPNVKCRALLKASLTRISGESGLKVSNTGFILNSLDLIFDLFFPLVNCQVFSLKGHDSTSFWLSNLKVGQKLLWGILQPPREYYQFDQLNLKT